MPVADLLRLTNVGMALALVLLVGAAAVWAASWDQRERFLTLGGYGVVTVGGQIDALGRPMSWPLALLTIVTAAAVLGTAVFLTKVRRGDAGPASDQLSVPGARARPRGGRHSAGGPVPERRGEQA